MWYEDEGEGGNVLGFFFSPLLQTDVGEKEKVYLTGSCCWLSHLSSSSSSPPSVEHSSGPPTHPPSSSPPLLSTVVSLLQFSSFSSQEPSRQCVRVCVIRKETDWRRKKKKKKKKATWRCQKGKGRGINNTHARTNERTKDLRLLLLLLFVTAALLTFTCSHRLTRLLIGLFLYLLSLTWGGGDGSVRCAQWTDRATITWPMVVDNQWARPLCFDSLPAYLSPYFTTTHLRTHTAHTT